MSRLLFITISMLALLIFAGIPAVSAEYYTVAPDIRQGGTVFIGEQDLNVTSALVNAQGGLGTGLTNTTIGWWASPVSITSSAPTRTIDLSTRYRSFTVAPLDFVGYTGNWYATNSSAAVVRNGVPQQVFSVADPYIDIKIWDLDMEYDMTGRCVPRGEPLGFRIETNMYPALDADRRGPVYNNESDGFIDIHVKTESGARLSGLYNLETGVHTLLQQNVSRQPWTWGSPSNPSSPYNWSTGARDPETDDYRYPVGTYTVWAHSGLNNMKDNYKNAGADYTGKTVSQTYTITLVPDTVKIEANKDSVVRGKPFSVTITGHPRTIYHLWVMHTSAMKGDYNDQPPFINQQQDGVRFDTPSAIPDGGPTGYTYSKVAGMMNTSGGYLYQNERSPALRVWDDVAHGETAKAIATLGNGSYLSANVTTSVSGTRTVEFLTTNWTKTQKYIIRVEKFDGVQYKSDEVDVKVENSTVTIMADGNQSYTLGDMIKFSGTNTGTYRTYLFLAGPGLPSNGAQINPTDRNPQAHPVVNDDRSTFRNVDVNGDNSWYWKWGTWNVTLDAGTYTVYAVDQPKDKDHLATTTFGTVSIIIEKPLASSPASRSSFAGGDSPDTTGNAEASPSGITRGNGEAGETVVKSA